MARITVEDCLDFVDNRFDLVLKAADRAHRLELGAADSMVEKDNDKATVLALREIASGYDVVSAPQEEDELVQTPEEAAKAKFVDDVKTDVSDEATL